ARRGTRWCRRRQGRRAGRPARWHPAGPLTTAHHPRMTSARRLRGALAALVVALLAGALLGGLPAGADGPVATTVAADGTPDVVDEDDSTGPTGSTSAGGG